MGRRAGFLDPDGPALVGTRDRPQTAVLCEKLAAAGFSEAGRDIPIARLVALADSAGKAAAIARNGAEWIRIPISAPSIGR